MIQLILPKMKNNKKSQDTTAGWVLVSKDNKKVLVRGKTLKQLVKNIEQKGNLNGSISIVPPNNFTSYVG